MKKSVATWLIAALALILVAAVAVLVFVEARGSRRPALYRNLDGHLYSINTQVRTPGEDGLFRVRFVLDGETVEYTVADQEMMDYIDSMEVMGLTVSKEGAVQEVFPADTMVTEVCRDSFIKSVTTNEIVVNTSLAMNGSEKVIRWNQKAVLCDVSRSSSVALLPAALRPMDGISVYADAKGNVTHIFVTSHPTDSAVYWRVQRKYSSTKQETTRTPDDNGIYTIEFYSDGKLVELKCKDKAIVTSIDAQSADSPHFGFGFDRDGYIVEVVKSALGLRGLLACEEYDITEITENSVTAKMLTSNKGEEWTGEIGKNFKVYDISPVAQAEGRMGQEVESIQVGDRVTLWTDTANRACEAYIINRLVDSPAYFNVTRKYDSDKKETTRTPDENGMYQVELLKTGDTEPTVFITDNKDLVTAIDKEASRCVAIAANDKGVLTYVYPAQCVFGNTAWGSSVIASSVTGSVVTKISYGKPNGAANGVMMPECVVYNVSTTGNYGEVTKLQQGDYFYAFRQPTGELVQIYVVRRCLGPETLYYNLDRQYDAENKKTARTPDGEGMYVFTLAHEGSRVTLKTDDPTLADALDSYNPGAVSLVVEGDKILEVNDPKYACGGNQVSHNYVYQGLDEKGRHVAVNSEGKESVFTLAEDCVIYDVRGGSVRIGTLQAGATLTGYTDRDGKVRVMFIR